MVTVVSLPYAEQAAALARQHAAMPAVRAAPLDQAELFLRSVWSALPDDPTGNEVVGLVADSSYLDRREQIRKNSTTSEWEFADLRIDKMPDLLSWASERNNDTEQNRYGAGSVFWMGATRRASVLHRNNARGRLDELMRVGCLWADLDCATQNYPLEKAFDALLQMRLPPTFVIFSGGGLQAVHILRDCWPLFTPESANEYKMYSRAFYSGLHDRLGMEMDTSVHNADRMMRLPGFINRKPSRKGAQACILWHNPANVYAVHQIRDAAAPHLPPPRPVVVQRPDRANLPLDAYSVSQRFISILIHGTPVPTGERHSTILSLSCDAARAGMPQEQFQALLFEKIKRWYVGESYRDEVGKIIDWAYTNAHELTEQFPLVMGDTDDIPYIDGVAPEQVISAAPPAEYLVKVSVERPAELAPYAPPQPLKISIQMIADEDEALRQVADRVIELDEPPKLDVEQLPLEALRKDQENAIQSYLSHPTGKGTLLRLHTPPGAGKTHQAIQTAVNWALRVLREADKEAEEEAKITAEKAANTQDKEEDKNTASPAIPEIKNGVIIATLFKMNRIEGREWARQLGIDVDAHPRLFCFFEGRSDNEHSRGFCAQLEIADAVARKGRNVVQSVCNYCPFLQRCKERHYLSQFDEAKKAGIIVIRAQHLYMSELLANRKLVIIDESPLNIVAAPIIAAPDDMNLKQLPSTVMDQWPDEVQVVDLFLSYLRDIMLANDGKDEEASIKLGGAWLFEQIIKIAGEQHLKNVVEVSQEAVKAIAQISVYGKADLLTVSKLPQHFLPELLDVLKHEYKLWTQGAQRWNSRIIPHGPHLHIYPMEPFAFAQNTRVIVTDATELHELYPAAFTDNSGRPRKIIPYRKSLEPRGNVTVYLGSENTKRTLLGDATNLIKRLELAEWFKKRRKRDYTIADTAELSEKVRQAGHPSLAQVLMLIHQLSEKHNGSLLIVLYKRLIETGRDSDETFLRYWLRSSNVLNPHLVQWFGNLRGRNDYKHLNAVFAVGTPRLRESNLFALAQVWNYHHPLPLEWGRMIRIEPFAGYVDENGKGRAYRYIGYKDDRINRLFLNSVQSELAQCYERIRKNSSDTNKSVYLATAFPCADSIQEFQVFHTAHLDEIASQVLQAAWDDLQQPEAQPQPVKDLIERIKTLGGVSERTAWTVYKRVREEDSDPRDGVHWSEKFELYEGKKSVAAKIADWLKTDPSRRNLSIREAHRRMVNDGVQVGLSSVSLFWKKQDNQAINGVIDPLQDQIRNIIGDFAVNRSPAKPINTDITPKDMTNDA